MNIERSLGLGAKHKDPEAERRRLQLYINLKLSSTGQPTARAGDDEFMSIAQDLLKSYREKNRLLANHLCPVDRRIQDFLDGYLDDIGADGRVHLPANSVVLDRYGVARELSLPFDSDEFKSDIVSSYRVRQGILHNPANDRRTTQGSFHIAEGGLPIPGDKKSVPKLAFARLLASALNPPEELLRLPFTANQTNPAKLFVSLLLRPVVCPEVPGVQAEKSMEIRCFAPGNLVSNLDFLESIFGNAGNPNLPENDAALDVDHWTGHTGCMIFAPHLVRLTKKALGLPHYDEATLRQRADGMCWQDESECYNDGNAFKITARDKRGVMVTVLADNYYGYGKKEVKTQISYSANLFGLAEEEHAGGALAFQSRNHGEEYGADSRTRKNPELYSFERLVENYGSVMDVKPEGYAIDKHFPDLIYVPLDLRMDLRTQAIRWTNADGEQTIRLRPGKTYMQPNGYKIEMRKHPAAPSWRLIGIHAEGVFCHKPCTVSGDGKSEISKSSDDAVIYGPVFVQNLEDDLNQVAEIFNRDYSDRFRPEYQQQERDPNRPPLSPERSLGSVIKLLTPSPVHTDDYNKWLDTIPPHVLSQVLMIKRFYKPGWADDWRTHFSVDVINGKPGHALKLDGRELVASYLRVGLSKSGNWRTYKVRQDFIAAEKVQMEDDISASVVVSRDVLPNISPMSNNPSVKLVKNCEYRLFQRPDDAIHRGFDKQTEFDMAQPDNFIANFEPLVGDKLAEIVEDVVEFQKYTAPMLNLLQAAHEEGQGKQYVVSSANPRLIKGKPSQNPRYLQIRPDLQRPMRTYIAEMGTRINRQVPLGEPLVTPVNAVLTGRRNNPPGKGIRPLAVFNPIHYQELPELFMDFVCSVTGKSPSTTGAGSEGALTKGPFNALRATADLNNALVSFIVTGYAGFSSAAGYIGPNLRVDHDISLLIPEIWARLEEEERDPAYLIQHGCLEPLQDFEYRGQWVLASRLGYRITDRFVAAFMGKIFDNPAVAMDESILKPETQDLAVFVDGVNNIIEAQQQAAQHYLDDGSIDDACPPLKALLYIMATGKYEGKDAHDPSIRSMFSREYLLNSDWYRWRLEAKQQHDIALWERHCRDLESFLGQETHRDVAVSMDIAGRLAQARATLENIQSPAYLDSLKGTIGADLLGAYPA
ncbi:hypothetical protein [Methylomagnum sp.]